MVKSYAPPTTLLIVGLFALTWHSVDSSDASNRQKSATLPPAFVERLLPTSPEEMRKSSQEHREPTGRSNEKRSLLGTASSGGGTQKLQVSPFEHWDARLLLDVIPIILGQEACNMNGSFEGYREVLFADKSNEEIMLSSAEQIIERSGYAYELHQSLSDDGYWTKLLRLKNPLMGTRPLKQPPVMLLQAASIGPTAFLWASAGQHHPELPSEDERNWFSPDHQLDSKQRETEEAADESQPVERSFNRSLAFMLANQGYDVWLVESRNSRHGTMSKSPLGGLVSSLGKTSKSVGSLLSDGTSSSNNMTLGETVVQMTHVPLYWSFSFDELVRYELKNQIERVLELSGANNVSLVSYSLNSLVTLPFLASRASFVQKHVHNLVLMAPVLSVRGTNNLFKYLYRYPCLSLLDELAALFSTDPIPLAPLKWLFVKLGNSSPVIRYKMLKFLFYLIQGPSGHYRTFLEPAVFGHLFEPTSLLQVKHFCQQVLARRYQRYDYGKIKNLLVYGQSRPPAYNLSQLNVNSWLLISAANDNLGTRDSIERLLDQVELAPEQHLQVAGFAHLDLVAAVDNDRHVNLPILSYLERHRYYLE